MGALQEVECSGPEYCHLVHDVWIDSENIWQFEDEWRDVLPAGADWQDCLMNAEERVALAALPDPVPVFRGYSHDDRLHGLSWTTERERAEWFAHRFAEIDGSCPRVAIGTVSKTKVIAYLCQRNESEVVALAENVNISEVADARDHHVTKSPANPHGD